MGVTGPHHAVKYEVLHFERDSGVRGNEPLGTVSGRLRVSHSPIGPAMGTRDVGEENLLQLMCCLK